MALRKKIFVSLLIFVTLFSGAWYLNGLLEQQAETELHPPPPVKRLKTGGSLPEEMLLTPSGSHIRFAPREYIKIHDDKRFYE